jgi:DNA-binding NtrC family response regulator
MASVLMVDDDPDVLSTLAAIVKSAGHCVVKASSGMMALDILDGDLPIDLMVTDVTMPDLNGFSLARMARERRQSLKVLYLTGFHEMAVAMRDIGERYGKMLNKPLLPAELRREVNDALATDSKMCNARQTTCIFDRHS